MSNKNIYYKAEHLLAIWHFLISTNLECCISNKCENKWKWNVIFLSKLPKGQINLKPQMFDFSTHYIIIPHDKRKTGILKTKTPASLIKRVLKSARFLWSALRIYFPQHHPNSTHKYFEVDLENMLQFFIGNIDAVF